MPKKTLLSALLISTLGLSTVFGADAVDPKSLAAAPTVMSFTAHSKKIEQRVLAICDQECIEFPFSRTAQSNADQITIRSSTLAVIDPWFFQNNKALKKVSFEGSTVNLEVFRGQTFLDGCDAIEAISFKGAKGVDLATFLEQFASPTLLQRILDKKCKLFIDMEETGATMANFAQDGVVKQDAIHFAIRTAKILETISKEKSAAAEVKPSGWLSAITFGYLGQ
jgi:hypothetical protein